jgi:tetratricopeptide (TPR) repeat protein
MAQQRLLRHAAHSAKLYASETLVSIVSMQDALEGGNANAKRLTTALDAIRESQDFADKFGALDTNAIERLVAVHETTQLKNVDVQGMSIIQAAESYLNFAEQNLVTAAGGAREASDALVILGMVERDNASPDDAHALAIAATLQRAAVRIEPHSMVAHRELGTTYLRQGLFEQAAASLRNSLAIKPTRIGYQRLLDVARRTQDHATAEACQFALQSDSLPSDIPVFTLSPTQFASTHRPTAAAIQRNQAAAVVASSHEETNRTEPARLSLLSKLPFGRK